MKKSQLFSKFNLFILITVLVAIVSFEIILRVKVAEVERRCMKAAEEMCAPCQTPK